MHYPVLHSGAELAAFIDEIGLLPLLRSGVEGWSAEEMVDDDCGYTTLPDGGWEWPLWEWKGSVIQESGCAYGKFFMGRAGFVSRHLWPDFCNWRRHSCRPPEEGSIEEAVLFTLETNGEMITRELRSACGFTGTKMRSRFDRYVTLLEKGCRIVTKDFVYPHDRHGRQYGWGWSLLTTPELLFGRDACHTQHTVRQSHDILLAHLRRIVPQADESILLRILG